MVIAFLCALCVSVVMELFQGLIQLRNRRYSGFGGRHVIEGESKRRQKIEALFFQVSDALPAVRPVQQVFGRKRPKTLVPPEFTDHLNLATCDIQMDPIPRANGTQST